MIHNSSVIYKFDFLVLKKTNLLKAYRFKLETWRSTQFNAPLTLMGARSPGIRLVVGLLSLKLESHPRAD